MQPQTSPTREKLFQFLSQFSPPHDDSVSFPEWEASLYRDTDGDGRPLFAEMALSTKEVNGQIRAFIQYGLTAFGFTETGDISSDIHYPIIRLLCFQERDYDAGKALLEEALADLPAGERVYAFFHHFGMSCYPQQGRPYEAHPHIRKLLEEYGFSEEDENLFYRSLEPAKIR